MQCCGAIQHSAEDCRMILFMLYLVYCVQQCPAGPGFTAKPPIRKQVLTLTLHSRLILLVLASRIWRALHESVNFLHDPETQYKSLSVSHRPGGWNEQIGLGTLQCVLRQLKRGYCAHNPKQLWIGSLHTCRSGTRLMGIIHPYILYGKRTEEFCCVMV